MKQLINQVEKVKWRKTTTFKPPCDHEYILKPQYPELWESLAKEIDEKGVMVEFFGKEYRCLYMGEYKYWYIDDVLNRENIKNEQLRAMQKRNQ
jgi:hypothetical protein